MRILIDYRPALRSRTGVGEYIHQLARALAQTLNGDDLTVFSSSWKDRLDATSWQELRGVTVADKRVPVTVLNAMWHRLGWPPVELLTGSSYDVVHSPHPLLLPARGAAQVVTIHDLDFISHPEWTRAEIRRDYAALVRGHAQRADLIVVSSRYAAGEVDRVLGAGDRPIVICPAGKPDWDEGLEEEPLVTPRGYILFMGTLEPRKNIPGLLDAYARLVARRPETPSLVLAGRATEEARQWLAAIERPPLGGRVRYLGYVADKDRRRLYQHAGVFVLPSFVEGFGLPALEAMSLGVPVVASNRGALPEVVGDSGVLVAPDQPEEIASAIERLISDAGFRQECAGRARARARQFSWTSSARALHDAYGRAMAARRERVAAA